MVYFIESNNKHILLEKQEPQDKLTKKIKHKVG